MTNPTFVSQNGIDCIKGWEALGDGDPHTVLLEPYEDSILIWTLGWGHALVDHQGNFIRSAYRGDPAAKAHAYQAVMELCGQCPITTDQAQTLLDQDLKKFADHLAPVLADSRTSQEQFDALASFSFNVGIRALSNSTVLARHKAGVGVVSTLTNFNTLKVASQSGHMEPGVDGALAAWSHAGGKWSLGVFRRRMCEAMIYRGNSAAITLAAARAIQ